MRETVETSAHHFSCMQDVEYFSSLLLLEHLGNQETKLIMHLEAISNELKDDYVKNKLEYFQFENELFRKDVTKYIANPLNAFSMIKRATVDLSLIIERISVLNQPVETIARYRIKQSSLTHAVKCLLVLQRFYKLSTDDLARGIINYRRVGEKMSPNDLFVIGTIAANNLTDEVFLAREYLELALKNHRKNFDHLNEVDEIKLLMIITSLCERMHDYKGAALYLKELLMKDPDNIEATEYAMKIVALYKEHGSTKFSIDDPFNFKFIRDGKYTRRKEFELMSDVCRGKMIREESSKMLHCQYVLSAPFVRFKMEEVSREPYIALFIDVLSDNEIQSLKRIAAVATVGGDEKSIYDAVQVAAELYDKDHSLVARISRRIEQMTGLMVDENEPLWVQHIGSAGIAWQRERERRMATILFYMNDDHMDGYTAFPYLKLRLKPNEGSALFWFTLKHSGEYEYGTRFTQCPVMYKSKWIAFKNLYERGQEFKRPCKLYKNEEEKISIEDYDRKFF
ncbi:hypothetical protein PVAND_012639 [Polypedilum vanderplanki]|uniref:Prolyl 4-hydroxylase alpha subunit domain-containing protein n=1 Tax=Polypedilum vanderplanki TaxID=319348 RepID=A0A9J6CM87_POLVA|nr:hypothetical protein PVAND_012639 [Polypedilum vanderplanki]